MAYYIKAKKEVAEKYHQLSLINQTADGCYLLWQSDLATVKGDTIFERAANIGGIALTPEEAREETLGTVNRPLPGAETDKKTETDTETGGTTEEKVGDKTDTAATDNKQTATDTARKAKGGK